LIVRLSVAVQADSYRPAPEASVTIRINELFAANPSPVEAVPKLNCVELKVVAAMNIDQWHALGVTDDEGQSRAAEKGVRGPLDSTRT
jgi:hypothetical protein